MQSAIRLFFLTIITFCSITGKAQQYDVLNYSLNNTPANGVKIKTNLPFTNSSQMVTLNIEGYNYGLSSTIGLNLVYYIYGNAFVNSSISSYGGYTPEVYLANENGKVIVFINDKVYYQRFRVKAFAQGIQETLAWFQGWSTADEGVNGTATLKLAYKNKMAGQLTAENVYAMGNVGIGTTTPTDKLSVNGNIRAKEVKVETANWPDYVFEDNYKMKSLTEIEAFIKTNKHLPGIPNQKQVEEGVNLGEMNRKLLEKVEELTLILIQERKERLLLETQIRSQQNKIEIFEEKLEQIEK